MKRSENKVAKAEKTANAKKSAPRKPTVLASRTARVTKEEPKLYKTGNDLPKKSRVQVIELLNARFADAAGECGTRRAEGTPRRTPSSSLPPGVR